MKVSKFDLIKVPDRVLVYGENHEQIEAEVEFEFTEEGMIPVLRSEEKVVSVLLKWQQKIRDESTLYFGDHFERSYGDLHWQSIMPERKMFWYFLSANDTVRKAYGVKTLPNAGCIWYVDNAYVTLELDVSSGSYGVDLQGRQLKMCEIIEMASEASAFDLLRAFCQKMSVDCLLPKEKVYGANTWYNTYGNNLTEEVVMTYTDHLVDITKDLPIGPYMVIDDGWQIASKRDGSPYKATANGGPWQPHPEFGDMKQVADTLKIKGVKPGIWTRPLLTTAACDEEMVIGIKSSDYKPQYMLDPTHPKVLELVGADVSRIALEWGYQLLKHDFTTYDIYGQWGFEMLGNEQGQGLMNKDYHVKFYDNSITTVEAIKGLYQVIKDNKGDHCIIMGCNTVSHLSTGFFEVARTGDDTSGYEFSRTRKMGVNAMASRLAHHNTFYAADADCIGIKKDAIDWRQNEEWLKLLAISGTPLFFSADFSELDIDKKGAIKEAFKINLASEATDCQPLDWSYRSYPERWQSRDQEVIFDWYLEQ